MVNIHEKNPQDFLSIVTDIQVLNWGGEVRVICLDDPVTRQPYVLVFKNCVQVRWDVHDSESVLDLEDNLIGVLMGKENCQEPAVVTGGIFELQVLYESFEIHKLQDR
jgi:hypothetical protein